MRVVQGVRILTDEQIARLSDHGLHAYRHKVLGRRQMAHDCLVTNYWCCSPPGPSCYVYHSESREPTPKELGLIHLFDRLAIRCNEERESRKYRRGA